MLIFTIVYYQQVEDKHTRTLHLGSNGKSAHRSKSHQQNNPSYDKMESSGMFAKTSDFAKGMYVRLACIKCTRNENVYQNLFLLYKSHYIL